MFSPPILVPGSEHRASQSETHSMSVGSTSDSFKTMTPPNVSRSLSNRKYYVNFIIFIFLRNILKIIFIFLKCTMKEEVINE